MSFSDTSTASDVEKARRVLQALSHDGDGKYFFDDGYPRREILGDAAAALEVLNCLASALASRPLTQEGREPIFQMRSRDSGGTWSDWFDVPYPIYRQWENKGGVELRIVCLMGVQSSGRTEVGPLSDSFGSIAG